MDNLIIENSFRLISALILGGIIGLEREYRSKDAGFRTHFLVALGAALFTIVSQYGFGEGMKDSSRVAAQVVSGIGFIGAGLIVFQKNVVRGLTTAAGLWVTAAIGMACGVGMYSIAVIVTVLILFGLEVLNGVIPQMTTTTLQVSFTSPSRESAKRVVEQIKKHCLEMFSFELHSRHSSQGSLYEVRMEIKVQSDDQKRHILDDVEESDDVTMVSIG
ncbi:MAG: MgtC/SapB family protein [Prevotella sp.]